MKNLCGKHIFSTPLTFSCKIANNVLWVGGVKDWEDFLIKSKKIKNKLWWNPAKTKSSINAWNWVSLRILFLSLFLPFFFSFFLSALTWNEGEVGWEVLGGGCWRAYIWLPLDGGCFTRLAIRCRGETLPPPYLLPQVKPPPPSRRRSPLN